MKRRTPNESKRGQTALLGAGIALLSASTCLYLSGWKLSSAEQSSRVALASAPEALEPLGDTAADPVAPPAPETAPAVGAQPGLAAWLDELAAELVHEPYQPRVFQERCEGCLFECTPELRAELQRELESPPADDGQFVALASLGRAQTLRLGPALAARLRPLALREDVAFGVALESARALVAGCGAAEITCWCDQLESASDPRSRSIAAGALDALRDGAAERLLVERALELGDPRVAARLLDALGRALEGDLRPDPNPARTASAARLADFAGDPLADAGLRARALGVLRCLDPDAAQRLASEWFLEPGAGSERIEYAASSLHGRAEALDALRAAQADPRIDALRRVRLSECVLFAPPEQLDSQAREQARVELRTVLLDSGDGAARRRALHALARFGTDADRARVQQMAANDPDLLARAAARSALAREASDWR